MFTRTPRTILAVVAVLGAATLSSCATYSPSVEGTFVASVRDEMPKDWASVDDDFIIELGRSVICGGFDGGETRDELLLFFTMSGVTSRDGEFLIALAVDAFCPEYEKLWGA